jgi:hypothetical protein
MTDADVKELLMALRQIGDALDAISDQHGVILPRIAAALESIAADSSALAASVAIMKDIEVLEHEDQR